MIPLLEGVNFSTVLIFRKNACEQMAICEIKSLFSSTSMWSLYKICKPASKIHERIFSIGKFKDFAIISIDTPFLYKLIAVSFLFTFYHILNCFATHIAPPSAVLFGKISGIGILKPASIIACLHSCILLKPLEFYFFVLWNNLSITILHVYKYTIIS